uniref:Pseudouridine synthase RsuA/RluA-like domain-containing protein n=1 Tax=Alexandrium monilatum TaxID=311494 RepID=A0A7S4S6A4_9DINO
MDAIAAEAMAKISEFTSQEWANTAWAFARLGVENEPLFPAISAATMRRLPDFSLQELANLAWAFASLGLEDAPLLHAIAEAARPKLAVLPEAGESPMTAVALVEAFTAAEHRPGAEALLCAARAAIERSAEALDGAAAGEGPCAAAADAGSDDQAMPSVVAQRPPLLAVWKPPGWTVAVGGGFGHRPLEEPLEPGGAQVPGRPLEEWLSSHLAGKHPIVHDPGAQHGLLHRLDLETSGVISCSINYRGYYMGLLQFVSRQVRKAYLCLCCGRLPAERRLLEAPLRTQALWPGGPLRSRASPKGRPARTELRSVAHLSHAEGTSFSLVQVHLHTGRTHQIRAHLSGEGHPLVSDTAYGGNGLAQTWCERLFLHASRLALDVGDGPLDVRVPLPEDLRSAVGALAAAGPESRALMMYSLAA